VLYYLLKETTRRALKRPEETMFMGKGKKAAETSGPVSAASQRPPRYSCAAYVSINGFEGQALLRNISIGGFCLESRTYAALKQGEEHSMTITSDSTSGLAPFEIKVEVRWVRSTETSFNAGFAMVKSSVGNRAMEKYIDYLKVHSRESV
jgi:hypothetical protein